MLGLTPAALRRAAIGVGVLLLAGLALGYAIGLMVKPRDFAGPVGPASEVRLEGNAGEAVRDRLPWWQDVYVNDYADLLDNRAEEDIRADLIGLYDATGIEMTVLTIESRGVYGSRESNETFATRLFNAWGIGNAARNDGVLILVSRFDREMRIELGAGYAQRWDAEMKRVIDDAFLPSFREDRYQDGIQRGVDETIRALTGTYPGMYDAATLSRGVSVMSGWVSGLGAWLWGLLSLPLAGLVWLRRRWARYRPRDCSRCGTAMILHNEEADDAHLSGGQRLEEFIRSVDYDIWECPACGDKEINRYAAWFSSYGACPSCAYKTLSSTTEVLRAATTSQTGLKRIDYLCRHCDHRDSEQRTIPKVSKSSSGSSRSSFGGGSSSGGGASGSW